MNQAFDRRDHEWDMCLLNQEVIINAEILVHVIANTRKKRKFTGRRCSSPCTPVQQQPEGTEQQTDFCRFSKEEKVYKKHGLCGWMSPNAHKVLRLPKPIADLWGKSKFSPPLGRFSDTSVFEENSLQHKSRRKSIYKMKIIEIKTGQAIFILFGECWRTVGNVILEKQETQS